jgi:20S proteasome alpha/beta subunit
MTSIVGIACQDGVVIGTDSSATLTTGRLHTIEQSTDKLEIIHDMVIVAGTGQMGLGQRFCEVVRRLWSEGAAKKGPIEFGKALALAGIEDFASTQAQKGSYGALVAFPCNSQPHLCEFSLADFQPELKDDKFWYVSMGSGQTITDPFLGFIREVFWESGRPKLQDAIFAVTWALEQAVQLNAGGVNGPIRLAVLERVSGNYRSRRLSDEELGQHRQNVAAAKAHLREFRAKHDPAAAESLPDVPRA